MKPTLKEIEDNYERVLLRLHSGELARIVKNAHSQFKVLKNPHWIDKLITNTDLDKSYNGTNLIADFNIDAIAFMNDADEVVYYINNYDPQNIAWDWDINNPHLSKVTISDDGVFYDDQMDARIFSVIGTRYNITEIDDIIKGDNNNMMNEILEIYDERELKKINEKYTEMEQTIKQTDPRYKIWKECVDTLEKLYKEDKVIPTPYAPIVLADETMKKLSSMFDDRRKELDELYSKKAEVNAQLSMCETYEQKQEILRRYNIINKNGKITG